MIEELSITIPEFAAKIALERTDEFDALSVPSTFGSINTLLTASYCKKVGIQGFQKLKSVSIDFPTTPDDWHTHI